MTKLHDGATQTTARLRSAEQKTQPKELYIKRSHRRARSRGPFVQIYISWPAV